MDLMGAVCWACGRALLRGCRRADSWVQMGSGAGAGAGAGAGGGLEAGAGRGSSEVAAMDDVDERVKRRHGKASFRPH
jgi:hypothetical protein